MTQPGCEVWWATTAHERPAHVALLNAVEQGRRDNFRRPEDRARFTVAASLLRLAVARTLGLGVDLVEIDRTCPTCAGPHGRPRLKDDALFLSVSHSGDRVVVALSASAPVGIDVEQMNPVDVEGLGRHVLGPGETADDLPSFYRHWTRKEAIVKATGDGLRARLDQVLVGPDGRVVSYPAPEPVVAVVVDLAPGEGYAGALASLTESPLPFMERDGTELLS